MSDVLLRVRDLSVRAENGHGPTLVDSVSLTLEHGRVHGLVGESGSGKSMTASAIAGLLPAGTRASGSVLLGEVDLLQVDQRRARDLRTSTFGFVFQNPKAALNPRLTVGQQLHEALDPQVRSDVPASVARSLQLLDEVGIPAARDRLSSYPHELSGGLAQRVVIAMALARDPQLLIADEPTTALDTTIQAQILDLIDGLRDHRRFGVLLITHDMGIVGDRADDITVLSRHRVVEQGATAEVLENPRAEQTRLLIAGARLGDGGTAPDAAAGEELFVLSNLTKTFITHTPHRSTLTALDDVSVRVSTGRSLGIVGESGSGKTTLARILLGLETADSGTVEFQGTDVSRLGRREARERRTAVQFVFQDPWASLNPHLTILESLAEPLRAARWSPAARRARVAEVLEEVSLDAALAERHPRQLSGGQLQRAAIARALVLRPRVLVADEPVASLDVTVQARIIALLERLRDEFGLTYVLISHDLRIVKRLCHDVIVMTEGVVVERGATATVFDNPQHAYTRTLLNAIPGGISTGV